MKKYLQFNSLYIFILLYGLSYMCNAIYGTFIPIYLNHIGYNKTNVGILLSLAPVVAIIGQPIWGTLSDRAKYKNSVLKILILGNAAVILFYGLSNNFFYLSFIITCFTFFQTSLNPMTDAITLEYSQRSKWHFGRIRLAGTLGYCIMSVAAGIILKKNINIMFSLYFFFTLLTFAISTFLPKVKGHQVKGKKVPIWTLFKDRRLLIFMSFALIVQITLGYYNTFFGIYFQSMGASSSLLGVATFLSAFSEVPFLLLSHRILKRVKIQNALLFAGVVAVLRWFLLSIAANIYVVLALQLLHGLIYIVIAISLATYINDSVPKELKASGQALNGIMGTGIARVIGSLIGGYLSDIFGIKNMFTFNSLFVLAAILLWGLIFFKHLNSENVNV